MLGDPKEISKVEEAVNPPTGGVSLLLDLNKASNARSGNQLRDEINCRCKIDFGENLNQNHQEDKVGIGPTKPTTRLGSQIPKAQLIKLAHVVVCKTRTYVTAKYLSTYTINTNNHFNGMPQAIVQEKRIASTLV
jgi:hypothetical protein